MLLQRPKKKTNPVLPCRLIISAWHCEGWHAEASASYNHPLRERRLRVIVAEGVETKTSVRPMFFFFPPTAESYGVFAQIGPGVVWGSFRGRLRRVFRGF